MELRSYSQVYASIFSVNILYFFSVLASRDSYNRLREDVFFFCNFFFAFNLLLFFAREYIFPIKLQ